MHPSSPALPCPPQDAPVSRCRGRRSPSRRGRSGALPPASERYRQLADSSRDALLLCREGIVVMANASAAALLRARDASDLSGLTLAMFIEPDMAPDAQGCMNSHAFRELSWRRLDGTRFTAEACVAPLLFDRRPALQIVLRDVSERKSDELLRKRQNDILHAIATGKPLEGILRDIEQLAEQFLPDARCRIALPRSVSGPASQAQGTWPITGHDGTLLGNLALAWTRNAPAAKAAHGLLQTCRELAAVAIERHAADEALRALAQRDALTGLPNRRALAAQLEQALGRARRQGRRFALLFIDLDRFKAINDSFGHEAGDHALRTVAARMRACLREHDLLVRIGGDEFVVLLDDLDGREQAARVARKLAAAAARPISIQGQDCMLGASVGIACHPEDGEDAASLLMHADGAMYRAKRRGRAA